MPHSHAELSEPQGMAKAVMLPNLRYCCEYICMCIVLTGGQGGSRTGEFVKVNPEIATGLSIVVDIVSRGGRGGSRTA